MFRGSRLFLSLITAAVASAAMADGPVALPRDEHYPAAYLHKASLEEARTAEALRMAYLMRGHKGDEAKREFYTSTASDDWLRLGSHPLLAKVFPGAAFYLTSPAGLEGYRAFAAVRDGKYYLLPKDVVRLLYDCGVRFEDDGMPTWLRAIAVIQSIGPVEPDTCRRLPNGEVVHEFLRERWNRARSRVYQGDAPLLPVLEIENVRLDTAKEVKSFSNPGRVWRAVIFTRRNGKKDSVEVQTMKNGRLPAMLGWTILRMPQSSLDAGIQMDDSVRTRKSPQEW